MALGMLPSSRAAWLLLASAAAAAVRGQGLTQTYCSNQNTGADYQGGRDESDPMFGGQGTNIGPVNDIYNSNGACQTQCQGQYAFAIVQWQNCWCSNYIPADQSNTSDCNQQCPGYPDESCGNEDMGMYGYVALDRAPSGTAGGSSPTQRSSTVYSSPSEPSYTPPPPSSTETPTETSYTTPSTTSTSTPQYTSTVQSTTPPSTQPTPTLTPVVSTRVVTVSGQQVTQTVTSTPYVNPGSDEQDQQMTRSGVSGGAIAGIVIGTLIGLAAVLLAAFLLWRRKKQQDAENAAAPGSRPPKRTTSVLSKTGLLTRGTARPTSMAENNYDEGYGSVRHSMLFGGAGATVEPSSPLGGSQSGEGSTRRHSKPLVYDQRLNPSALFANAEANGSRVSMQDTQDYSRPLGIANPDIRASFESRNDVR